MTIGMTARQGKRWGLSALAATICCFHLPATSHAGDGPSIFTKKPNGPLFKTLDAFAGGIEHVLEKTVLRHGKGKQGCDSQSCDDGCDAIMLHQLEMHRDYSTAVPEAYATPPMMEPTAPMPTVPPMIDVEPTFDRQQPTTTPQPANEPFPLPVPKMTVPPLSKSPSAAAPSSKAAPMSMPRVPIDSQKTPVQKQAPQPNLSSDDSWIDSFAPSTPSPKVAPPRQSFPAADDSLPDPFQDDPQTRVPQRFAPSTRPSVPTQSTRMPVRKVKAVGFTR